MDCLDNKDIKYEGYTYRVLIKLPGKNQDWKTEYESWIPKDRIEEEKAEFVRRYEEMDKADVKLHHKYCMEYVSSYNEEACTYLEYIMGFVSLNQNE